MTVGIPAGPEVEEFIDQVDEVHRLITCLQEGTITPEYVDKKLQAKQQPKPSFGPVRSHVDASTAGSKTDQVEEAKNSAKESKEQEEEKKQRILQKVQELKHNLERKKQARDKYQAYINSKKQDDKFATDYAQWDMWCPSDDEDDMVNSCTPNTPEFQAMEKDVDERHKRMVEQRQIAERQRMQGNELFKQKRYSEAYQCYEIGISHQKHSMILHANAALVSLKMNCNVQAIEHCDKVLSLAEFLHNKPNDPLCVKALQRRASAFQVLQQHSKAVNDLQAALDIEPVNGEVAKQLQSAKHDLAEHRKQQQLKKLANQEEDEVKDDNLKATLQRLRKIEDCVTKLATQVTDKMSQQTTGCRGLGSELPPKKRKELNPSDKMTAAKTLTELLDQSDDNCIYFRDVGGLSAGCSQVVQYAASPGPQTNALLKLLNTACFNDKNLTALLGDSAFLNSCVKLLSSSSCPGDVTSAAVAILYTMTTVEAGRKLVSSALCRAEVQSKAIQSNGLNSSAPGLQNLFILLQTSPSHQQATILSLVGNCSTMQVTQHVLRELMKDNQNWKYLLMVAASKSIVAAEKALSTIANMCGDQELRRLMCAPDTSVLESLLKLASNSSAPDIQLSSLTAIYNMAIEPEARSRMTGAHAKSLLTLLQGAENARIQERCAGVLSRTAKNSDLLPVLQSKENLANMLQLLSKAVGALAESQTTSATVEHVVRIIAYCTTSGDKDCLAAADAANIIPTLLAVLKHQGLTEAAYANAALALGSFAQHQQYHKSFRKNDAPAILTKVAYNGKGSATSKNAAITLARLAHDPAMMEQLRELRAVEIIYQYVKP